MRDINKIMGALSSPVRREILALIWSRELPAGEIASAFAITKPTISQHLSVLRDAGLVTMTAVGNSRRYRAQPDALDGLHAALEGAFKWTPADEIPEAALTATRTAAVVIAAVDVAIEPDATFEAFTDPERYSRWLGAPVTISDGRFAATMEWGTEVRGSYDVVCPPRLIAMRWDFDDDNIPVPGRELVAYLRLEPSSSGGTHVEVHQLVESQEQASFMEAAWGLVLGRLQRGVEAWRDPEAADAAVPIPRPRRAKRRRSA